ncbi:MAG: CCA tRNA nucleotidyltransferase [Thermaerobacter sp.]|nr:CCA tRNA nucleotidyltransferase [Thermaerobacter sp.]
MGNNFFQRLQSVVWPGEVADILNLIKQMGFHGYVVGGAVRNQLWDLPVAEWDLTTDLPLAQLLELFGDRHPGAHFGTVRAGPNIEITVMRREAAYSDARHPDEIEPTAQIELDLARRDFTVNAVAVGLDGAWWAAGAEQDVADRRLRTVGDPTERFREDPLRILRLVRLLATCRAIADPASWQAARVHSGWTARPSRERRLAEFLAFLRADPDRWGLWAEAGLMSALEWPDRQRNFLSVTPDAALARLYLFMRQIGLSSDEVLRWTTAWPLLRSWRQTLKKAWTVEDPLEGEEWARRARLGGQIAGLWSDLARAAGFDANDLAPIRPVLPASVLAAELGVKGPLIGELDRLVRAAVAADPLANRPATLRNIAQRWAHGQKA